MESPLYVASGAECSLRADTLELCQMWKSQITKSPCLGAGLDSHAALAVMKHLISLTDMGLTVVASIHQPRQVGATIYFLSLQT